VLVVLVVAVVAAPDELELEPPSARVVTTPASKAVCLGRNT